MHDRLGSVRLVFESVWDAASSQYKPVVRNLYTYDAYGKRLGEGTDTIETIYNPFQFTGQWYDAEIGQYYLRARQYDPQLLRFTSRDPVFGGYEDPMTLHRYLYCANDPINRIDPKGEFLMMMDLLLGTSEAMSFTADYEGSKDYEGVLKSARGICDMVSTRYQMLDDLMGISMGSTDTASLDAIIAGVAIYQAAQNAMLGANLMKAGIEFASGGITSMLKWGRKGGHHPYPKWLGGPKDQFLHKMGWRPYHKDILEKRIAERMYKDFGFHTNWKAERIQEYVENMSAKDYKGGKAQVMDALMDEYRKFDYDYGTSLTGAFWTNMLGGIYD